MHKDSLESTSKRDPLMIGGETEESSHHYNKFPFRLQLITDYCMQLNLILPMSYIEMRIAHITVILWLFVLSLMSTFAGGAI